MNTIGDPATTAIPASYLEARTRCSVSSIRGDLYSVIRLIFTWLPAAFALFAGVAYVFYPLRDTHLVLIEEDLVTRGPGQREQSPALSPL